MKCLLCKSDSMEKSTNTYFAQLENCYVLIENVPCFKCGQCGEVVYSASVMEKIEDILEKVRDIANKGHGDGFLPLSGRLRTVPVPH